MAITLLSKPVNYARVYDTNRMTYSFTSDHATGATAKSNFQYQFILKKQNFDGTQTTIGSFNLFPLADGTVQFNPSTVYRNYLTYDFNASTTTLEECTLGSGLFSLSVYEFYSDPVGSAPKQMPTSAGGGQWPKNGSVENLEVYNACQQNIPYDYVALNAKSNALWVMSGSTSGRYLTDATEYHLDNDDMAFLYFMAPNGLRPITIRYTIYYWGTIKGIDPTDYLGMNTNLNYSEKLDPPLPRGTNINLDDGGVPLDPPAKSGITSAVENVSISYTNNNVFEYYFPIGPYQLTKYGTQFFTGYTNTWAYYKIDLMSGSTVMNVKPFYVYKKNNCEKYGKWRLFWLNPHGGWDTYTFDRKNDTNYKIKRTTYQQKLPQTSQYTFSPYDAGEKVFNVNVDEIITLRTTTLTQKESQLLIQLTQSPKVYAIYIYTYSGAEYPYGVPYIINTDSIRYEKKVNSKEITMEIELRAANPKIIQKD